MSFCFGIHFHAWLHDYGSMALFVFMAVGIAALPLPVETLLMTAGALMADGDFPISQTLIGAYAGALCGMTASYLIGCTAGQALLKKYGHSAGSGKGRFQIWLERSGKWILVIGYFIPGVRHVTGIWAGANSLRVEQFALFAYGGAFLWVSVYLFLGYFGLIRLFV